MSRTFQGMRQYTAHNNQCITMGLLVALLWLTAALVWHDLGAREVLGRDENATITKLDQPNLKAVLDVTFIKNTGQPGNMQPAYFLVQYLFWPVIQRSAFMLRFLPSTFGVLVVALTYKLGQGLFGSAAGLNAALLTALLPLQIRYAQIARPYTLLAAFSLASACLVVQAMKTNRLRHWLGFVLTATLGFYSHYAALFVLAAEGLFLGMVWLIRYSAGLKPRQAVSQWVQPALSLIGVALLCLPGLIRLFRLPWLGLENELEAEGTEIVTLTVPFFRHFLYESGLVTRWMQNGLAVLIILGLAATLVRGRWPAALFTVLWLAVPFVTLALINLPRPFEERYVIFVLPVAFLLVGQAVAVGGESLSFLGRRWNRGAVRGAITVAFTATLAWILAGRVRAYFATNRAADRLEQMLVAVEHHARSGDIIVISPRFFLRPLSAPDVEVLYLTRHPSFEELDAWASRQGRMWILCTSYPLAARLQEPIDQWLQIRRDWFVRIPIKALNVLAFETASSGDTDSELVERIAVLEELAQQSAAKNEERQRYGLLVEAYLELADLYTERHEDIVAADCRQKAEQVRAAHALP